jgi:dipeptidyl aminopeptidase/acylaminoacyl peptidase
MPLPLPRTVLLAAVLLLPGLAAGGEGVEVASRAGANAQRPVWSADGRQLSWEANFHDRKVIELYVGDPKRKAWRRILPAAGTGSSIASGFGGGGGAPGKVAHELTFSPPSQGRFVYSASSGADDYELHTFGGAPLAPAPGADGGPVWSPDGRHIVFTSARTGQGDLYLIHTPTLGAPPKRLTRDATSAELFPAWSPDGERLVYVGRGEEGDNLWLLDSLTGTPEPLTDWPRTQTAPAFSPDGRRVAFFANRDQEDRFDLYVVEARAGARPTRVATSVKINPTGPQWTPDGRHLVVTCEDDAAYDPICVAPAEGGQVRRLDLGTVGHGDLALVQAADGGLLLAYTAQGHVVDDERSWKRLFVAEVSL